MEMLQRIGDTLHLPQEKLQKDLELYRSNLEKMAQAQIVLEDAIKADRKKREQREQEKKNKATTPPSDSPESTTAS
jgi:citrate synthase